MLCSISKRTHVTSKQEDEAQKNQRNHTAIAIVYCFQYKVSDFFCCSVHTQKHLYSLLQNTVPPTAQNIRRARASTRFPFVGMQFLYFAFCAASVMPSRGYTHGRNNLNRGKKSANAKQISNKNESMGKMFVNHNG